MRNIRKGFNDLKRAEGFYQGLSGWCFTSSDAAATRRKP